MNPLEDLYIKFRKGEISKNNYDSMTKKVKDAHEFIKNNPVKQTDKNLGEIKFQERQDYNNEYKIDEIQKRFQKLIKY